jgi:hypothetical protein
MLSGEAANGNFIFFGLTLPESDVTIYRTRREHANATDMADLKYKTVWDVSITTTM